MIIEGTDSEIPDSLIVEGDLCLYGTGVTSLPDGLVVGGDLELQGTKVASLPDGLIVGGFLDLWNTGVTELPDELSVGDYLNLWHTGVTELPDELSVGGDLWAEDDKLIASEELQLSFIAKRADMLKIFKAPTEKAKRLHQMLWDI